MNFFKRKPRPSLIDLCEYRDSFFFPGKVLLLHPDWFVKYKDDIEEQGYKLVEYLGENYE